MLNLHYSLLKKKYNKDDLEEDYVFEEIDTNSDNTEVLLFIRRIGDLTVAAMGLLEHENNQVIVTQIVC